MRDDSCGIIAHRRDERLKRAPKFLRDLRTTLLRLIPAEQFDECQRWVHWDCFEDLRTTPLDRRTETRSRELLGFAQKLLAPLADNEYCRRMRKKWGNTNYAPPGPVGDYWWGCQVEIVQEVIWLYPEFVEGFRFGRTPSEPFRDANPYVERGRSRSWDWGYILGIAKPGKLTTWMRSRPSEAVPA